MLKALVVSVLLSLFPPPFLAPLCLSTPLLLTLFASFIQMYMILQLHPLLRSCSPCHVCLSDAAAFEHLSQNIGHVVMRSQSACFLLLNIS
ncbi:hypothetical protein E4T42_03722 [Aureobasidium subglaciale]|nr:hypothetical protein E4T42_03722 [Aureobasidium subglaciale]